jgi:hypothetical protein
MFEVADVSLALSLALLAFKIRDLRSQKKQGSGKRLLAFKIRELRSQKKRCENLVWHFNVDPN